MKTFTDNAGRTWTVSINTTSIKRVRDLMEVDLLSVIEKDNRLLEQLYNDYAMLVDVVYCLCKPQADEQNITDEQFGQAMYGDAIEHATVALLGDLCDFFPKGRREVIKKAMAKLDQLEAKAIEMASQQLDSPELDRQLNAIMSQPQPSKLQTPGG